MTIIDQIIKDANAGIAIAEAHIETGQQLLQDGHEEGNQVPQDAAKKAIDAADKAISAYRAAVTHGLDEDRIDAMRLGQNHLQECEFYLTEARNSLKPRDEANGHD
jgi:hypothetical protein